MLKSNSLEWGRFAQAARNAAAVSIVLVLSVHMGTKTVRSLGDFQSRQRMNLEIMEKELHTGYQLAGAGLRNMVEQKAQMEESASFETEGENVQKSAAADGNETAEGAAAAAESKDAEGATSAAENEAVEGIAAAAENADAEGAAEVADDAVFAKASAPAMSAGDYKILQKIVQAESGNCDLTGKILVANVVLNRVNSSQFPDNVKDVVYQKSQFSPVSNGSIDRCTVSAQTKEAVDRALAGEDYSQGALYFMNRAAAKAGSVRWFDRELTYLFRHGGHEFYR